jgi:hypothetical protein
MVTGAMHDDFGNFGFEGGRGLHDGAYDIGPMLRLHFVGRFRCQFDFMSVTGENCGTMDELRGEAVPRVHCCTHLGHQWLPRMKAKPSTRAWRSARVQNYVTDFGRFYLAAGLG